MCCCCFLYGLEGGCGGGDRLESPVEIHSIFVRFFACVVVVFVWFGGGGGG